MTTPPLPPRYPQRQSEKAAMKSLPLLLTLSVLVIGSGCSSSGPKSTISGAAIGAVGAYAAGATPDRAASGQSGGGFIYAEHAKNRH